MWLVREVGQEGGLLCRTQLALDIAVGHYQAQGAIFEVVETNRHMLPDPAEC